MEQMEAHDGLRIGENADGTFLKVHLDAAHPLFEAPRLHRDSAH
jgi:hypothetical protein